VGVEKSGGLPGIRYCCYRAEEMGPAEWPPGNRSGRRGHEYAAGRGSSPGVTGGATARARAG